MISDERLHEQWLQNCRDIDKLIAQKKVGTLKAVTLTMARLKEMREYAFMQVEHSTVDHVVALHRLKKELNLYTNYTK
jgi:hypothetical protein